MNEGSRELLLDMKNFKDFVSEPGLYKEEDEVVLQCIATIHKEQSKFCFAAEGLGNRLCCLQPTSEAKYIPPDLCVCNFVPEQSVSVRALQEMLANTGENGGEGAAQGGGHRTLLYGHAILLRHSFSGMYLTCLTTSRSQTDKLAFDVGLWEHATGSWTGPSYCFRDSSIPGSRVWERAGKQNTLSVCSTSGPLSSWTPYSGPQRTLKMYTTFPPSNVEINLFLMSCLL
nr:ryanodine receptor 3-like [Aotus nancymaae]